MRLALLALLFMKTAFGQQVIITQTGSTNRLGMTITMGTKGDAVLDNTLGSRVKMKLESELHTRLMRDVEAAAPVSELKPGHCAKSVSFGTSTYVTYKGLRSPDLSCHGQTDPAVMALQKDVEEIMALAREKMPAESRHRVLN